MQAAPDAGILPQDKTKDGVRTLADSLRTKQGIPHRTAVVGDRRFEFIRGKDFARYFEAHDDKMQAFVPKGAVTPAVNLALNSCAMYVCPAGTPASTLCTSCSPKYVCLWGWLFCQTLHVGLANYHLLLAHTFWSAHQPNLHPQAHSPTADQL